MNTLLFGLILSALLSTTSLLIVLFRVSPLTAPLQAIPALFLSVFLSVTSISTLLFLLLWQKFTSLNWDTGKLMTVSLRQGVFVGTGTMTVMLFHVYELLTWWVVLLIYLVFVFVELALDH